MSQRLHKEILTLHFIRVKYIFANIQSSKNTNMKLKGWFKEYYISRHYIGRVFFKSANLLILQCDKFELYNITLSYSAVLVSPPPPVRL